jgi:hypothetical protein
MSSDSGSASGAVSRGGTSSPAIVPAAGPPPPPVGRPEGTGASVEQNMAFAQFQERARGEG